jgi:signal transduction histidine kinase/DNA-binding NarL/FixJ family response regulator
MGIRTDPGRVLYVANDRDTDVLDALGNHGLDVVESQDISDAIAHLERERIDCVVAPFALPPTDGLVCCEKHRENDGDVPFFLLVPPDEAVDPVRAVNADMTDVVSVSTDGSTTPHDFADAVATSVEKYRDRIERESELQRESQMLQSLLENIPLSIYFKDEHGIHEQASQHVIQNDPSDHIINDEGKVHQHVDDVIGKSDLDLYDPDLAEQTLEDDRTVMDEGEPVVDKIEEGTTALGDTQYFSTTKAPRYDADGNAIGLVGVTLNVTERMEHKQAVERQNDRLEEFASVVSDDLRNPLDVAEAHLSAIESGGDVGTAVAECRAALDRMEQLIEDVLVFAREGRTVEETEPVDLSTVTRAAWQTVDTGGSTLETDSDLPVQANQARVTRLLENLLRNAVEHGSTSNRMSSDDAVEHGRPDGTDVTVRVGDMGNDFYVEDDGVGIPEDRRGEVLKRGVTTSSDGTGFGLAIARNIASAHGWDVTLTESDEGGVRFEFTNVVRADVDTAAGSETQVDADPNPHSESVSGSDADSD